jgi:hypothetical protein
MRRAALVLMWVATLASGCVPLDFVAPTEHPGAAFRARVQLDIERSDLLSVDAALRPPGADGATIPDSTLLASGARVALRSPQSEGPAEIWWSDSLAVAGPMILELVPPAAPGVALPPTVRAPIVATEGAEPRSAWWSGLDLVLPLETPSGSVDAPAESRWFLHVDGWKDGEPLDPRPVSIQSTSDLASRELLLAAAVMPDVEVDSLRVEILWSRRYRRAAADSSYVVDVDVAQRLVWWFTGAPTG